MKSLKIHYSHEVKRAYDEKKAIVALESTIITHGMPYPENRDTAVLLEETIRANGATPATIAIIDGTIRVGLSAEELDNVAKQDSNTMLKVSTKDIPFALVQKRSGGTTVAATMYIAHLAGISVFATGGIGGVHRGAETSFDISADLDELSKTPVAVVCAGAKSILDLRLTLEYLETKAVPVIGYKTEVLPAFYTRNSNFNLDMSLDTVEKIAKFLAIKWSLVSSREYGEVSGHTGVVIANPIPEEYSMDESYIHTVVEEALQQCSLKGIVGKATTPFLLSYIAERTEKKSLFSNIQLVKNNALLGAKIAAEYTKIRNA